MELHLAGKVFIVTGGSSGIGEAVTRQLVEEGAIPVIATREKERSLQMVKEFKALGKKAHAIIGELRKIPFCKKVIQETAQRFGRIDGLVNNAGRNDWLSLEAGTPDRFSWTLIDNLYHYHALAHYALPWLKLSKGSIVNVSCRIAVTGQGNASAYAAAKGAQLALTREWATELAKYGIRVNAVVPSEVDTPQYQEWHGTFEKPAKHLKKVAGKVPLGKRLTTPEEVAAAIVYLLSERSSHTTGQFLFVDGGYTHLDRAL
ncbi:MAG: short-chain dehydrogenase [Saprospirales bacterium]|nr:short-chain dehydrogenase [Saprospirales bacterium]